ncbi:MAG: hypothetical protein ACFUZC_07415 [Chthoniobacteraceae bacterium]
MDKDSLFPERRISCIEGEMQPKNAISVFAYLPAGRDNRPVWGGKLQALHITP